MKFLKLLVMVGGLAIGLALASYAGVRARAGEFLGPKPPDLGARHIRFVASGIATLPGRPRAWEVAYSGGRFLNGAPARIYISPTGALLGTVPTDLRGRLDRLREREP